MAQDAALSLPLLRYRYICHVPSSRINSLAPTETWCGGDYLEQERG